MKKLVLFLGVFLFSVFASFSISTLLISWAPVPQATQYEVMASTNLQNWELYTITQSTNVYVTMGLIKQRFFYVNGVKVNTNVYNVTLAWNASPDAMVTGYYCYYGVQSQAYTNKLDSGTNCTITVSNLNSGIPYYFAVTAYAYWPRIESEKSNEIYWIPPVASRFRIPCSITSVNSPVGGASSLRITN